MDLFKYSVITGTLNQVRDRYMGCGYRERELTFSEIVDQLNQEAMVDGVELSYSQSGGPESDIDEIKKAMEGKNLSIAFANSSLFGERKWSCGSLASADPATRKEAVKAVFDLLSYTRATGAAGANLWLGQDGFDYPFQTDYRRQWNNLIAALRDIADYAPDIQITLEPKLREPRNRSLVDTVPTALLMCFEADRQNLGLTVDVGHVLQGGQNMAQSIDITMKYNRLFNVHINDNYGSWDDDLIAGSVHFIEYLELLYFLKKNKYDGWVSVDIFPFREDPFAATRESILNMKKFSQMVDRIGLPRIEEAIQSGDFCETQKMIRETVL